MGGYRWCMDVSLDGEPGEAGRRLAGSWGSSGAEARAASERGRQVGASRGGAGPGSGAAERGWAQGGLCEARGADVRATAGSTG